MIESTAGSFLLRLRVYWAHCYTGDFRWQHLSFYVFTYRATHPATSGGDIFSFYVFTELVQQPAAGPSWGNIFLSYVFTSLSAIPTTSGGHIFLDLKKDMEERQTKGLQSRPLETCFDTGERRGDVRTSYEFAQVQLTRFRPVRWRAVGVCLLFAIAKAITSTASTGLNCTAPTAAKTLALIE